jgi:hypothetical protein
LLPPSPCSRRSRFAAGAAAVIIDSGDGTGNTSAPSPDPGFANVGTRYSAYGAVYIGAAGC